MSLSKPISLEAAVTGGKLNSYLNRYLADCRPPPDADPKKEVVASQTWQAFAVGWAAASLRWRPCAFPIPVRQTASAP